MEKYTGICEEELKNKLREDLFKKYDCAKIIGNIDFTVRVQHHGQGSLFDDYLLWAEAKKDPSDICEMLTQLILTIAKEEKISNKMPPPFLGCFDCEKIAFIEYKEIIDVLHKYVLTHFDVKKITPTNHGATVFKEVYRKIKGFPVSKFSIFYFEKQEHELKTFIKDNFTPGRTEANKIRITMGNFINVYYQWQDIVKPTIQVPNWDKLKKDRISVLDGDFYLADLLSKENKSIKENLSVLLEKSYYKVTRYIEELKLFQEIKFSDNQAAHTQFWNIYERPPENVYWDEMTDRRDLLVPRDVRERKGSFYTPEIWVKLSQKYIADVFGEDWQDEYYVWDCAAGTGNLLAGLANKRNLWASTLDKPDVDIMHDRIDNGMNLLKDHCFQFDFLNDDFSKLSEKLQKIIKKTPEKLIIYINPPYAEAANYGKSKDGVSKTNTFEEYKKDVGSGLNELFIQFLTRIYNEIPRCKIVHFAKLKALCASNFMGFRRMFLAKLEKLFIVPADTFDNVTGQFPIGLHIWDTNKKEEFESIIADIYDEKGNSLDRRTFVAVNKGNVINDWLRKHYDEKNKRIGYLRFVGSDLQGNKGVYITNRPKDSDISGAWKRVTSITSNNLIHVCIYIAVRNCIEHTWLNDRDQFLYPNKKWEKDIEFQNNCLAYTLFHGQNMISSRIGVNHWIPFSETEAGVTRNDFDSHFMLSFIGGKIIQNGYSDLFEQVEDKMCIKREFSPEAKAVFDAGKKLWKYYHKQPNANVNASFYDIREHFQGRKADGKMNPKSEDEKYTELIAALRAAMKILAKKIEPKVYEYGFLRK